MLVCTCSCTEVSHYGDCCHTDSEIKGRRAVVFNEYLPADEDELYLKPGMVLVLVQYSIFLGFETIIVLFSYSY